MATEPSNIPTEAPPERSISQWLDSSQGRWTGAALAAGATLVTARDAIGRAYFKSLNKDGADTFADLQEERDRRIGEIVAPAREGKAVPDAMERVGRINTEYDVKLRARQKLLGVHNVFDEMKALKRHQWMEVLMSTGAVGVVALGAVLAIASNRDIAHKQEELEKKENGNGHAL